MAVSEKFAKLFPEAALQINEAIALERKANLKCPFAATLEILAKRAGENQNLELAIFTLKESEKSNRLKK